ncbi:hypothetical protein D3C75_1321000 [compost metagenome]
MSSWPAWVTGIPLQRFGSERLLLLGPENLLLIAATIAASEVSPAGILFDASIL